MRELGVHRDLKRLFWRLKSGPMVVYPMEAQLQLLLYSNVVGEHRVFGLEALAADPLFVKLAGGVVPSLDTVYRDLCRFDDDAIADLDRLLGRYAMPKSIRKHEVVHLDIDSTVEPLFGCQEGAEPGPNPRYHGRPSYHPLVARVAETKAFVGAELRRGDTSFGAADELAVSQWVERVRAPLRPEQRLYVRIDAAGDCAEILAAINVRKAFFVVKPRLTSDLLRAIRDTVRWTTVDHDANGKPVRQVAVVDFKRDTWMRAEVPVRVVAVRTREPGAGRQVFLWDDLDYSIKAYLTNDFASDPDDIARRYEDRAGIEPMIGEAKSAWGIGAVPSATFIANHAMLLLKLLAHNLVRLFVVTVAPALSSWSIAWLRRALICIPGRLVRSARSTWLRLPVQSWLCRLQL